MKNILFLSAVAAGMLLSAQPSFAQAAPAPEFSLDTLDLNLLTQDYGTPHAGQSVDGNPLTLGGVVYAHGVGTHAGSRLLIDLKGVAARFTATVGVDDEKKASPASVTFEVLVDGKKKFETPVLHGGDKPLPISLDVTGAKRLTLVVTDGGDGIDSDHADWADAKLTLTSLAASKPVSLAEVTVVEPTMPISMGGDSPVPAIHGPRIVGATPGHPFLFLIPATGTYPLTYSAKNLPTGLQILAPHLGEARLLERAYLLPVAFNGAAELRSPELCVVNGLRGVGGAAVPKAAMDVDREAGPGEHDVRADGG